MNDSDFFWRMYKYQEKERLEEVERIRQARRVRPNPVGMLKALNQFLDKIEIRLFFRGMSPKKRYSTAAK